METIQKLKQEIEETKCRNICNAFIDWEKESDNINRLKKQINSESISPPKAKAMGIRNAGFI